MLVVVAICSLTFNVAARFCAPWTSQSHTARSADRRPTEPKRQHLDRDATKWVAPVANFSILERVAIEARLAPAGPILPTHVFSNSLYNRPPPSSGFLL